MFLITVFLSSFKKVNLIQHLVVIQSHLPLVTTSELSNLGREQQPKTRLKLPAMVRFYPNDYNVQGIFVHENYLSSQEEFRALVVGNFPAMREWILYKVESDGSLSLLSGIERLGGITKFVMTPRDADPNEFRISPPGSTSSLYVSEECSVTKEGYLDAPYVFTPRWNGMGGTVLKKKKTHSPFESVDLDSKYTLNRERLLESFLNRLRTDPVIFVRGPPSSGKTSTSALLEKYILQRLPGIRVVMVSVLWLPRMQDMHVDDVWIQLFGISFNSWIIQANHVQSVIIFDETQMLYCSEGFGSFWDMIKSIVQAGSVIKVKFILFSAYGYRGALHGKGTPIDIPEKFCLGLPDLCFDENETRQFISRYFQSQCVTLENDEMAASLLFNLTTGHPGVCSNIVDCVFNRMLPRFRQSGASNCVLSTRDLCKYLCSNKFYHSLFQYRAFNNFARVDRFDYFSEVKNLFNKGCLGGELPDLIPQMLTDGIIRQSANGQSFVFFSPVAAMCVKKFFLGSFTHGQDPSTLQELVFYTCRNMSKRTLCSSLGRSSNSSRTPLERLWQMEFWRSASMLIDPYSVLSPDVGSLFGVKGYLDFTIQCHYNHRTHSFDSFWGVELLREGQKISEHVARFDPSHGRYRELVSLLNDFLVVDFRQKEPSVMLPSVLYVVYSDDFSSLTLMGNGFEQTTVELS
jgi:hypothetical protein